MKSIILLLALAFFQSTSSVKQEREHTKIETTPTQKAPKSMAEQPSPVAAPVSQPSTKPEESNTKDKSRGRPPWGDIFWPSWALVIVTIVAVRAALKTLGSINAQVDEMRKTGQQTDKLIGENIAQSKSMQQSVAEAARLASAMETVAKDIAISSKAATASVSAIGQQMRAYISVVIGGAVYQERTKNLKFQAVPSIVNAGLTPAHKVSFKAVAAILPRPLPEDFAFPLPDETSGTSVVGPRQNITISPVVGDFCDDAEVEDIKTGAKGKALYTWGIFIYEDI
jgi:hypothetical protein